MSAKISRAGSRLRPKVAAGDGGMQRLGALAVADAEIIQGGQQFVAVARAGPTRDPFRRHRGRPARQVQTRRPPRKPHPRARAA